MNSPTYVFSLSHRDCEELRSKLQAKADDALEAMDFAKHANYQDAIKILHEQRMESFQNRADKRRAKRRQSLDASTCKDG